MAQPLDFFLFYGSIHTYLSAMRIETLTAKAGIELRWHPFNLRKILIEQNNTAFVKNSVRLAYNWRDIERRAARLGIPFKGRAPYPVEGELLALRVGTIAAAEGWCAGYTRATFRAWFLDGKPAGLPASVESVLVELNRDPAPIVDRAEDPDTAERLEQETEAARRLGIFGAPSFAVGTEIFWGDDRLDEAIEFARSN
jgi:2-hydroxychromene-2-carboxylate isomerase